MKLLEFIDRRDARRFAQGQKKRDYNPFIGFMVLLGYFALVFTFVILDIPQANKELIQDAMLVLGPAIGMVISSLFRRDSVDEAATENTGKAFDAIERSRRGTRFEDLNDCDCQNEELEIPEVGFGKDR